MIFITFSAALLLLICLNLHLDHNYSCGPLVSSALVLSCIAVQQTNALFWHF